MMLVVVSVLVMMFMAVLMRGPMVMIMVVVIVVMTVVVVVVVREMDVELHTFDAGLLLPRDVQVIAVELELGEFAAKFARVHAQINQRADKHIAADAAEGVEI